MHKSKEIQEKDKAKTKCLMALKYLKDTQFL